MKKLMIAAAIVCAAAMSQAATFNWSINNLKDSKGNTLTSGYVYTFSSKEGEYTTTDALKSALLKATTALAVQAIADESFAALEGSVSSGSFAKTDVTPSASGLTPGKSGTKLFALITDTEDITADTKWYVTSYSNMAKVPTDAGTASANYTIADTGSATSSNWHAIPEPTSGLLLLLGMAGLALKRKRA